MHLNSTNFSYGGIGFVRTLSNHQCLLKEPLNLSMANIFCNITLIETTVCESTGGGLCIMWRGPIHHVEGAYASYRWGLMRWGLVRGSLDGDIRSGNT